MSAVRTGVFFLTLFASFLIIFIFDWGWTRIVPRKCWFCSSWIPERKSFLGTGPKKTPGQKKKSVQFKTTKLRVLSVLISVLSFYPNLSLCNWILVRGWGKWQLWSYVGRGNWFKAARKFIFLLFRMQTDTIGVKGYYRNHCHSDESLTAATVNINGFGNWGMFHISRELGQI